jgi:NADH-quinone oxidoreductase subunit C
VTPARFDNLQLTLGAAIESALRCYIVHGMPVLELARADLLPVVRRLRSELAFDLLLDVTAVDWPTKTPRFEVVYHFYSTSHHDRVRVKTGVEFADPAVDSLVSLFGSANFMERECHDMYGIAFNGHPDMRPILLYEGFIGHPLRKDYGKLDEQPLVPYRM